jgi:hypothetical protein
VPDLSDIGFPVTLLNQKMHRCLFESLAEHLIVQLGGVSEHH